MDLRSRTGTGADGPGWYWAAGSAPDSASGEGPPPKDEDWATTTGYSSLPTRPAPEDAKDVPHDGLQSASSPAGSSGASDRSWTTEETQTGTPVDEQDHFHHDHEHEDRRENHPSKVDEEQAKFRRRYKPRTCRICFETVLPTFEDASGADDAGDDGAMEDDGGMAETEPTALGAAVGAVGEAAAGLRGRVAGAMASALPEFLRSQMPRVSYISENPDDGRLISPCRCKGSQKYVHEGCLQAWRHAQPLAERNFWTCPTCGFEYRVQRLRWGRLISNKATRALLTLLVFVLTLFVLGFVADPLMDLWLDPGGMIMDTFMDLSDLDTDDGILGGLHDALGNSQHGGVALDAVTSGWWQHFTKGFLSLGIVGVVKTFLAVSPFTWWNLRSAGIGRARRRAGGRARVEGMGWVFILVGAFTFLGAAWKGISFVSGRILERASEHIVDIGGGDDDYDEDEDDGNDANGQGNHHEDGTRPDSHNG